ncbi:hypothetical protein KAOT1_15488 [Kordia algicida OT-1]|uniref:Uncharacterized protein n=1 Tax=Kordia algicida OT-1 TaxID=391587 RepID=A9DQ57_9FLAO|nr:hypothetical protein KAOT1_15488 [Kordia algicida OT-1]
MKNQQSISQFKQFQIPSLIISKINGGEKKQAAKADEEIE